eukprot:6196033-Pleurochrysis_carterae.AAC.3
MRVEGVSGRRQPAARVHEQRRQRHQPSARGSRSDARLSVAHPSHVLVHRLALVLPEGDGHERAAKGRGAPPAHVPADASTRRTRAREPGLGVSDEPRLCPARASPTVPQSRWLCFGHEQTALTAHASARTGRLAGASKRKGSGVATTARIRSCSRKKRSARHSARRRVAAAHRVRVAGRSQSQRPRLRRSVHARAPSPEYTKPASAAIQGRAIRYGVVVMLARARDWLMHA